MGLRSSHYGMQGSLLLAPVHLGHPILSSEADELQTQRCSRDQGSQVWSESPGPFPGSDAMEHVSNSDRHPPSSFDGDKPISLNRWHLQHQA